MAAGCARAAACDRIPAQHISCGVQPMVTGFRQGLTATGFNEGQNVTIEYRYADDQPERLPGLVTELIRLPVAVIVVNGTAALAAKAATTTVPIVFATGSDPMVDGLVASLNRPGGNVTGVSFVAGLLGAKRLEMLRQLVATAATIAMLVGTATLEARVEHGALSWPRKRSGSNSSSHQSPVQGSSTAHSRRSSNAAPKP